MAASRLAPLMLLGLLLLALTQLTPAFLSGSAPRPLVVQRQQPEGVAAGNAAAWASGQSSTQSSSIVAGGLLLVAAAGAALRGNRRVSTARQACFEVQQTTTVAASNCAVAQMSFTGDSFSAPEPAAPAATTRHLLMPKNIKWKKPHKPSTKPFRASTKWKFRGYNTHGAKPHFGKYALQALEEAWITSKQIENTRRAIIRTMERKGKMWIRVFPHQAVTQRVAESRMGAGKGTIEYWVAPVRPNFILFEIDGVTQDCATTAFRKAKFRLPCKVRMLVKDGPSQFELGLAGKPGRGSGERTKFEGASK